MAPAQSRTGAVPPGAAAAVDQRTGVGRGCAVSRQEPRAVGLAETALIAYPFGLSLLLPALRLLQEVLDLLQEPAGHLEVLGDLGARGQLLQWSISTLVAPGWLGRTTGLGERTKLLRTFGVREAVNGVGVLMQRRPALGLWARVAGDALDTAVVVKALRNNEGPRKRLTATLVALLGVGALDLACARMLQSR